MDAIPPPKTLATKIVGEGTIFASQNHRFLEAYDPDLAEKVFQGSDEFGRSLVYRDMQAKRSPSQVNSMIIEMVTRHNLEGVFIDYVQLFNGRPPRETKAEFIANACQDLAALSKDLGIYIVTALQLNRDDNVRDSDGADMAFDVNIKTHPCDPDAVGFSAADKPSWLETSVHRYAAAFNLGSKKRPGVWLRTETGPFFDED